MHKSKFSFKGLAAASAAVGAAFVLASNAMALQWVTAVSAPSGGTVYNGTTVQVPIGGTLTFYGLYSDNSAGSESGLGLKVKFDGTKLTNVQITEEFTKCRIAPAQVQGAGTAAGIVAMGWIDTSIRRTSGAPNGAVGWPDVANPTAADDCLAITPANTDTGAFSPSGLKLFKMTAQWAAGVASGTTATVDLVSDGNFSYANASPGFQDASFTVQASGSGGGLTLAASDPIVSRKAHGAAGTFDIPLTSTAIATPTIEPRQATAAAPHRVVYTFTTAPAASGHTAEVRNAGGTVVSGVTATTSVAGNSVIVELSGVAANQRVNVTLNAAGGGGTFSVPVGFLIGDVNNSASVSVGDINAVRAVSGQTTTAANFKSDLNVSGAISVGDINLVRSTSGTTLAP